MLKTNELQLRQLAEAAIEAAGPKWYDDECDLAQRFKDGEVSGLVPLDKALIYACDPQSILIVLAELESARFAAQQHLQTVQVQARTIARGAPTPATHRLMPVELLPAVEEALKRHTPLPQTAWVEIVQAFDRVAASTVCAEMRALCSACGGTGDVHRTDGEYLGQCNCAEATQSRVDAALDRGTRITSTRIPL